MYTTRNADESWGAAIKNLVHVGEITKAVDIGCGGGIYSKALSDLGASSVTAVDFSKAILEGAKENCKEYKNIVFEHGNALETGLKSNGFNLLLERALIHHLKDLSVCFKEAYRILEHNGIYIIQDRTPEDCLVKGNDCHIRGYFFECFPRLFEKETLRRHASSFVIESLKEAGFRNIEKVTLWETREMYDNKAQLLTDIRERTGRSILHELDDHELTQLLAHIDASILTKDPIIEKDRWTIWKAVK